MFVDAVVDGAEATVAVAARLGWWFVGDSDGDLRGDITA